MMNNVSAQIQRVINDAISSQVFTTNPKCSEARIRTVDSNGTSRLRDRNDNPKTILVRKLGVVLEVSQSVSVFVTKIQTTLMKLTLGG